MIRVLQRSLFIALLIVAFVGCSLLAPPAQAQTGNWDYIADLGGWLDWDTGLVWGEHSMNLGSIGGWEFMQNSYVPSYRLLTGIPNWRMPTVSESQVAAAHGINALFDPPRTGIYCWTSESRNKGSAKTTHFAVNPLSGDTVLYNNGSSIGFIPVYRAFTP